MFDCQNWVPLSSPRKLTESKTQHIENTFICRSTQFDLKKRQELQATAFSLCTLHKGASSSQGVQNMFSRNRGTQIGLTLRQMIEMTNACKNLVKRPENVQQFEKKNIITMYSENGFNLNENLPQTKMKDDV